MIERQFIQRKIKEYQIEEFMSTNLDKAGYSHTEIKRTPLGEKITIYTSKPGLIVGREGANIKDLAELLKKRFKLDNPQVEVAEIENPNLNSKYVAKHIVHVFEKYGPKRFKSIGYKKLQDIINSGAIGAEIIISGRGVPSQRAKSWRFKAGYLKKSGDISENFVDKGYAIAHLRSGAVGIQVRILKPDVKLPDDIKIIKPDTTKIEQEPQLKPEEQKEQKIESKIDSSKVESSTEDSIEERKSKKVKSKRKSKKVKSENGNNKEN